MPARFCAYPPDRAATIRVIDEDKPYRIGRSAECELRIDHPSVSRFHAELSGSAGDGVWRLHDTASKNGLRVDGRATLQASFTKSTWFAVGDTHCQLEPINAAAAQAFAVHSEKRRSESRELSAQFSAHTDIGMLLPRALDIVLELSGLERGFILFAPPGEPLRMRALRGLHGAEIAKIGFSGSIAAIERALCEHAPVVCCDTADSPWLGLRPSVRLGGIRALACMPLPLEGGSRGAIYVDSHKPGPPVTQLDIELMQNVAEQAAAAIDVWQLQGELNRLLAHGDDIEEQAPRWDALRPS